MYIYQNGKLYAESSAKKIVGVDVYSDKVLSVKGTETDMSKEHEVLTTTEVYARFELPILFASADKGCVKDEPTPTTKRVTRKSTSK